MTAPATAPRFRHRPVVVQALQWDGSNTEDLQEFAGEAPSSSFDFRRTGEIVRLSTQPAFRVYGGGAVDEVWSIRWQSWCFVEKGDFVVREEGGDGVFQCPAHEFLSAYDPIEEGT